ncbi:hypothetical protein MMC07_007479 [Pseudocyphellaria aurata]|nr:hypothetical protein [Pseudocyphellaria aurata]
MATFGSCSKGFVGYIGDAGNEEGSEKLLMAMILTGEDQEVKQAAQILLSLKSTALAPELCHAVDGNGHGRGNERPDLENGGNSGILAEGMTTVMSKTERVEMDRQKPVKEKKNKRSTPGEMSTLAAPEPPVVTRASQATSFRILFYRLLRGVIRKRTLKISDGLKEQPTAWILPSQPLTEYRDKVAAPAAVTERFTHFVCICVRHMSRAKYFHHAEATLKEPQMDDKDYTDYDMFTVMEQTAPTPKPTEPLMTQAMYRIGVDVGGTNTDAALLDASFSTGQGVLATCKTPTTSDVTTGIKQAINGVLKKPTVDTDDVVSVAVGTTQFVNAVVEADAARLQKVAVVRLCGPFTRELPPFTDFPTKLRQIISGPTFYLDGGFDIDGREILPLDSEQILNTAEAIASTGISQVAIIGVFSALDHSGRHEERCEALMSQYAPFLSITCSRRIGGPGFLERENATILNASVLPFANRIIRGIQNAMHQLQLSCQFFLTQNDGTLTDAKTASRFPIKTFASGPTNSLTGAAFLAGIGTGQSPTPTIQSRAEKQILVVDIGGTTTDVCALLPSGFPRQASNYVKIGGVRTAFSMPEVVSIGLGGGSYIHGDSDGIDIGPDSVGHRLTADALSFGGEVLTTTDIFVAAGGTIKDSLRVPDVASSVVAQARKRISVMLQLVIDEMKVSAAPVVALLVGGGSIIQMDELDGVECIRPPHFDSANAVGAAIARVAGEVDVIEILEGQIEDEVVSSAKKRAIAAAIKNGADPNDVEVLELEKIPLLYVTNKAARIRVKAAGKLISSRSSKVAANIVYSQQDSSLEIEDQRQQLHSSTESRKIFPELESLVTPSLGIDVFSYSPKVHDGVWYLSPIDLEFISFGTGVLGTGGGGSSYAQYLACLRHFQSSSGKMRVISLEALKDSDLCVFGAWFGAPSVAGERIAAGTEIAAAIDVLTRTLGRKTFDAIVVSEIGGGNGLSSFPSSVHYDKPVVDADMMGRAFPTIEHVTPHVYGESAAPCALADAKGNVSCVVSADSNKRVESLLRSACIELGNAAAVATKPLSGAVVKQYAIQNTLSQAWYLGRAFCQAGKKKTDVVEEIFKICPGRLLYTGKIIDVTRDVSRGYTVGRCRISSLSADEKNKSSSLGTDEEHRDLVIPFQNEYLYAAYVDQDDHTEEVICTVPDLISILGAHGVALGSQELRYGLKVKVIGIPAHPLWTTERGLRVGGPKGLGLDMEWTSLGEYREPRSVIEEFNVKSA